ncbi:MAG: DUF4381 domain-containing protein [Motiliproteus sp.]
MEQLRDLQLPEAIGLWPPAPGWWLLAALSAGLLFWLGRTLYRHLRSNRYRKLALQELTQLCQSDLKQHPQQRLQQINQLLRRTALAAYSQQTVAPLSGSAWVDFLYSSSQLDGFRQGAGSCLASGPYQPQHPDALDIDALQQLARHWIRRHKRGAFDVDASLQPLTRHSTHSHKRGTFDADASQQPLTRHSIHSHKRGALDVDASLQPLTRHSIHSHKRGAFNADA